MSNPNKQNVVPYVNPSNDRISITTYVPSVGPFIASSQKQLRALQEQSRTTLEQVKPLENMNVLGEARLDEAD